MPARQHSLLLWCCVARLRGLTAVLIGALGGCLLGGCLELTYEVRVNADLSADAEYRVSMDTGFLSMPGDQEQEARQKLKAHAAERGGKEASGRPGVILFQRHYQRVEDVPGFSSFTGLGEPDAPLFTVRRGFFRDVYRLNATVDLSRADFESMKENLERSTEGISTFFALLSEALLAEEKDEAKKDVEKEEAQEELRDFAVQLGKVMESLGEMMSSELMKTVLQQIRFQVVLHLPFPVAWHNATEEKEGRYLRWVLEPGKRQELSMEAVVFKPVNVAVAVTLGVLLLAAVGGATKRLRGARLTEPPGTAGDALPPAGGPPPPETPTGSSRQVRLE